MSSIQRLRWVLVAGAVLLVAVLASYIGYGRYRQMRALQGILEKSGIHITRDTNGVTYSQSVAGKTIFTLHAAKATQIGDGKWALHDADMTLYGRMPDRPDHIYGAEFEYDEKQGIARALGEVHMDLQAPQGLSDSGKVQPSANTEAKAESAEVIHVRTSGVVYVRKLGVAATDQAIEFRYGGVECTAVGAEFNTGQNILHLLANVQMDGIAHGKTVHLTATHADLDRTMSTANLARPVVTSDEHTASANAAVLHVRKDGSMDRAVATGDVLLRSGTQEISSARLDATLNARSVPETAKLSGGITMVDRDPRRPVNGRAAQLDILFDEQGAFRTMTGTGGVMLSSVDRMIGGSEDVTGLARELKGQTMVATFVPSAGKKATTRLSELHVTGSARGRSESLATSASSTKAGVAKTFLASKVKTDQVAADDLHVSFAAGADGKLSPRRMYGTGHTLLQQDSPMEEQEVSTGDQLDATFRAAPTLQKAKGGAAALNIASAVQAGHVEIHSRAADKLPASGKLEPGTVSTASAERAEYDGDAQRLTLTGSPRLSGDTATLTAGVVVLDQQTGDAEAHGAVQTAMVNAPATEGPAGSSSPRPVTHVLSANARFVHATKQMEFKGTDAEPAKMWQDASQVQAATLLLDGARKTFSARPASASGMVHAVFAGKATQTKTNVAAEKKPASDPGKGPEPGRVVRVVAPKMDYSDAMREATFSGGVRLDGTMGQVNAKQVVVFLSPVAKPAAAKAVPADNPTAEASPLTGSLDRAVAYGDVHMEQPGRQGVGDQLTYTAASDSFVLTGTAGHPPHIVDAKQGDVTGATLVFGQSGSTIVVAGETVPGKSAHGRVRTETEVRP